MMYKFYYYIAKFFESRKKWELAIKFYLKAQQDSVAIVNYRLGFCYEKRKDFGNAIYFFKKAIALESKKAHWHSHLANAYHSIKKEGMSETDIFIETIHKKENDVFEFTIKGRLPNNIKQEDIILHLKSRETFLEDKPCSFDILPQDFILEQNRLFTVSFHIDLTLININNITIINSLDFYLKLGELSNIQYFKTIQEVWSINNYHFIPYTTKEKNFSLIISRLKSNQIKHLKKIKIGFILLELNYKGGISKVTIDLANALADKGYDVTITALILQNTPNMYPISEKVNFEYVLISAHHEKDIIPSTPYKRKELISSTFANELHQYFHQSNFDIIYTPIYGAQLFPAIINSIPEHIIKIMGDHSGKRYGDYDYFLNREQRITKKELIKVTKAKHLFDNLSTTDAIHIINPLVAPLFNKITNKPILSIPNIITLDPIQKNSFYSRNKTIVLVGGLLQIKNFDTIIKAFKKLYKKHPGWIIEIYGEGIEERNLSQLISKMSLTHHVYLKGFTSSIEEVYNNSMIHLSASHHESFGLTMVESMDKGCITISTKKTMGAKYLLDNEQTGFLADNNTEKDIYAILNKVMVMVEDKDPKLLTIQKNAYKKAKQFNAKNITKQWEQSFDELIRRKTLRENNKAIVEEDIFINRITLTNKEILKIHIQGHIAKDYDTTLVSLQCKTRHSRHDEDKSIFYIKSSHIHIDEHGIFDATFEIPSKLLSNTGNALSSIWDFYLNADKKTRLQCFEKFTKTIQLTGHDFIPYTTSKKTFSLISIRKSSSTSNHTRQHVALTISRIDLKTKTVKSIIDLANMLVTQNLKVTLIALDLIAMPNHFDINENINFEYISTPFHRHIQENFNFNQNTIVLPDTYTKKLTKFFATLKIDTIYMPIFGASFLNPILSSIPKSVQVVLGEYSDRRYNTYFSFIKNDTRPTLEKLIQKTKDSHFFENLDNIDAIHLIKPELEEFFTKFSNTLIFTVPIEGIDYPQELADKLIRFINEKNI